MGAPTIFVFIHGAWHGGWCWQRIVDRLEPTGAHCFTPTLTGLSDRASALTPHVSLQTHIDDIKGVIHKHKLSSVVLVGHSYGGIVATGVADQLRDEIAQI